MLEASQPKPCIKQCQTQKQSKTTTKTEEKNAHTHTKKNHTYTQNNNKLILILTDMLGVLWDMAWLGLPYMYTQSVPQVPKQQDSGINHSNLAQVLFLMITQSR